VTITWCLASRRNKNQKNSRGFVKREGINEDQGETGDREDALPPRNLAMPNIKRRSFPYVKRRTLTTNHKPNGTYHKGKSKRSNRFKKEM